MVRASTLHRLLLLSILIGLGFSLYAMVEVLYPAAQGTCSINPFFSCGKVDQSAYTHIGPVPDWLVGVGGFVLLLALDLPLLRSYEVRYLYGIAVLAAVGLAVAVGLGLVELTLIHAVCPICLGAYLSDAAVMGLALGLLGLRKAALAEAASEPPGRSAAADPPG
jgi:uncharacterized membrane protein